MHTLLLNTLPAPVVKDIAQGHTEVAHRYRHVTVLQADMCGFTPLSATRPPEEALGILGDLFGQFDELAERVRVHKLKTIGDAYVVIGGAFDGLAKTAAGQRLAAARVVRLALAMNEVVAATAKEKGIDIGVRIGVHRRGGRRGGNWEGG